MKIKDKLPKRARYYWGIVVGVILMTALFAFLHDLNELQSMKAIIAQILMFAIAVIILVICLFPLWRGTFLKVKMGMHNMATCGDPLFEKLDMQLERSEYTADTYLELAGIVNEFYLNETMVPLLVQEQELERLYHRMDYLEKKELMSEDVNSFLGAVALSLIASTIMMMTTFGGILKIFLWGMIIGGTYFALFYVRYAFKGKGNNYVYMIHRYEMDLLQKAIRRIESQQ